MSVVIDASVIVAMVVADERQGIARAHLERWLEAGESLHAPAVLPYEVADVLARLVFDGVIPLGDVADIWGDFAALKMVLHPFADALERPEVVAITERLRRRHATDSTYLCLASGSGRRSGPWTGPSPATPLGSGYPSNWPPDSRRRRGGDRW